MNPPLRNRVFLSVASSNWKSGQSLNFNKYKYLGRQRVVLLEVVNAVILFHGYRMFYRKMRNHIMYKKNPPLTSDKKDMEAETSS